MPECRTVVSAGLVLLAGIGQGQAAGTAFDPATATQTVEPTSASDPAGQVRCTYYTDFMVRETGTDSPFPGAAHLVMGPRRPVCTSIQGLREITLDTQSMTFAGRKGQFMLFTQTDPNGAMEFKVINISGHTLYTDSAGMEDNRFKSIDLEAGILHLRFTRAINAPCSILKSGTACMTKLIAGGMIPHAMAQAPLPSCKISYQKRQAGADDPSLISYDVDMTLNNQGKTHINSRSALSCDPMP